MGGRGQSSMSGAAKRVKGRAIDALAANGRNDAGMTAAQEREVTAYVLDRDHEVEKVRRVQQGENIGPEQARFREMGETIEQFISENETQSGIIWRGIRAPYDYADGLEIGQVIDQNGTSSWSSEVSRTLDYAARNDYSGRPTIFRMAEGAKAAKIGDWSKKTLEMDDDEYLLSRRREMRVVDIVKDWYRYRRESIDLVVVEPI